MASEAGLDSGSVDQDHRAVPWVFGHGVGSNVGVDGRLDSSVGQCLDQAGLATAVLAGQDHPGLLMLVDARPLKQLSRGVRWDRLQDTPQASHQSQRLFRQLVDQDLGHLRLLRASQRFGLSRPCELGPTPPMPHGHHPLFESLG